MDILENSIAGGATRVRVKIDHPSPGTLECMIEDNGSGMGKGEREKAMDPFFTTKKDKRFGLGLALFKQSAEETGGSFEIVSDKLRGTTVKALFYTGHPDMKPLGDVRGTVTILSACHPEIEFIYKGVEK